MRIALGYQSRVGKDTFAEYISQRGSAFVCSFAEPLYEITAGIQRSLGQAVEKDPALLQMVGMMMRKHYGDDVFVNIMRQKIESCIGYDYIIVTDVRLKNEYDYLVGAGFTMVKVTRESRVIDRDQAHPTEVQLRDATFDYCITNDGTLEEYYETIDRLLVNWS